MMLLLGQNNQVIHSQSEHLGRILRTTRFYPYRYRLVLQNMRQIAKQPKFKEKDLRFTPDGKKRREKKIMVNQKHKVLERLQDILL